MNPSLYRTSLIKWLVVERRREGVGERGRVKGEKGGEREDTRRVRMRGRVEGGWKVN